MAENLKQFVAAQEKSVDGRLPVGGWRVYPDYDIWKNEGLGDYIDERREEHHIEIYAYVQAPLPLQEPLIDPSEWPGTRVYAHRRVPGLYFEFANLFGEGRVYLEDAPQVVRAWAQTNGVLGRYDTYPTQDGGSVSGRFDDRESVMMFIHRSREAYRVLNLFSAATELGGPNVEKLRTLGVGGINPERAKEQAMEEVVAATAKYLEVETFTRLYRSRDDGRLFRGPGFRSLLGAMWLQMSKLIEAPDEAITRCLWCGDIITFEEGEAPPSDAPRGVRGKHKTHKNRKFCKEKLGSKDRCKNQYNADQRKKISATATDDACRDIHMRDARPEMWDVLTSGLKLVYDNAYRAAK